MRFNPPPNWPPAPPGWVPDSNWTPDPSWPPPPPGWPLWVDERVDDSALPFPPGYAAPYPPPYPPYPPQYQPQWPPQSPPGSRRLLWILLVAVVIVITVVGGLAVNFGGGVIGTGAEKPSKKPDITKLTNDLLVDRSAFPEITGGKWISGVNSSGTTQSNMPNLTTDPPECADLYGEARAATQTATATLANLQGGGLHSMRVHLAITGDQQNLKQYLEKCQTFTQTFEASGHAVSTDVRLQSLDVAGVPPWAVATVMSSSSSTPIRLSVSVTAASISGYYRGVLVVASSNEIRLRPKDDPALDAKKADDLVELFNTEVAKLEAAP